MKSNNLGFVLQALLAAVFFGASAPVAKILLGDLAPVYLAAFLYLGSGSGIAIVKFTQRVRLKDVEAGIRRADFPWLGGAIVSGGVLAPIVLLVSLQTTPASTASLLLNFESVGTTLIALFFFREAISRRAWTAILVITFASIFLSTDFTGGLGLSFGALGILLACVLWGLDNNFTRNISGKDPLAIVAWKGLVAGTFSFFLAWILGNPFPSMTTILGTLILGFISYGLSTMLFIRSLRGLGAARTSALYGTAPLAGVLLSILIFGELPSFLFGIAAALMIGGALLLINENHTHSHVHTVIFHEHSHRHDDHAHSHDVMDGIHSHEHEHPAEEHAHDHMPDIHHRHGHGSNMC
jgi:drug/metabolite transporter (DMT)-like permease